MNKTFVKVKKIIYQEKQNPFEPNDVFKLFFSGNIRSEFNRYIEISSNKFLDKLHNYSFNYVSNSCNSPNSYKLFINLHIIFQIQVIFRRYGSFFFTTSKYDSIIYIIMM